MLLEKNEGKKKKKRERRNKNKTKQTNKQTKREGVGGRVRTSLTQGGKELPERVERMHVPGGTAVI